MNSTVFGWLVVVGVVAVVVWLVARRQAGAGRTSPASRTAGPRPQPREIWWGQVPGVGDCPFLVLEAAAQSVTVLPITNRRDLADRKGYLPFRPDPGPSRLKPGAVSLDRRTVGLRDVRSRDRTPCPASLWTDVKAHFGSAQNQKQAGSARPGGRPQQGGGRSTSRPRDRRR